MQTGLRRFRRRVQLKQTLPGKGPAKCLPNPNGQGDGRKQHNQRFDWVTEPGPRHVRQVVREWVDQQEKPYRCDMPPPTESLPEAVQGNEHKWKVIRKM